MMPAAWAAVRALAICAAYCSACARLQASGGSQIAQSFAADVFHHDALHVPFRDDVVQRNDVGMVQGRSRLRFLKETALALRIGR